jgi:phosphate transport system permease protein
VRRALDRAFALLLAACGLLVCGLALAVGGVILWRGLPAVNWTFLSQATRGSGAGGGIVFQMLGTIVLVATALVVALPPALGIALCRSVYLRHAGARRALSLALYACNGVPSIVFGIFGFVFFVRFLGWGKSWLAGGILLGFMMVPTIAVAVVERLQALPAGYLEAARGLGLSREQAVRSVLLPQCRGGLVSGALLAMARAAGETAPLLFAAAVFAGASVPHGIVDSPVLALPYHIFTLAQDAFDPRSRDHLWGAAAVLAGLVGVLSALALPMRLRAHEEARHG